MPPNGVPQDVADRMRRASEAFRHIDRDYCSGDLDLKEFKLAMARLASFPDDDLNHIFALIDADRAGRVYERKSIHIQFPFF